MWLVCDLYSIHDMCLWCCWIFCDSSPLHCQEQENTKKRKGVWLFECGLYMFCIAYMICGDDVVEQFEIVLPYIVRNKKIQRNVRTWKLNGNSRTPKAQRQKPNVKRTSLLCSRPLCPQRQKCPKRKAWRLAKAQWQKLNGKSLTPQPCAKSSKPKTSAQRQKINAKNPNSKSQTRQPATTWKPKNPNGKHSTPNTRR